MVKALLALINGRRLRTTWWQDEMTHSIRCLSLRAPGLEPVATDTLKLDIGCRHKMVVGLRNCDTLGTYHPFAVVTRPQFIAILTQNTEMMLQESVRKMKKI